jgi:hypothetical protein
VDSLSTLSNEKILHKEFSGTPMEAPLDALPDARFSSLKFELRYHIFKQVFQL